MPEAWPDPPFIDRFPDVLAATLTHIEEHACALVAPQPAHAQAIAVIVRLSRASHVLLFDTDPAYTPVYLATALGLTGRIDLVEADEYHASLAEHTFARHGLAEKLKVISGRVSESVPFLNGPYDLIVAGMPARLDDSLRVALHRLLRAGGALIVDFAGSDVPEPAVVAAFANDERWMPAMLGTVLVAVKLR